jgi:hypothetical protein
MLEQQTYASTHPVTLTLVERRKKLRGGIEGLAQVEGIARTCCWLPRCSSFWMCRKSDNWMRTEYLDVSPKYGYKNGKIKRAQAAIQEKIGRWGGLDRSSTGHEEQLYIDYNLEQATKNPNRPADQA